MSRLKGLLRVASPSTRNTQQMRSRALSNDLEQVSRNALHVASASTDNTQQSLLRCCIPVAQHVHIPQQMGIDSNWREFESLLNLVAPAFNTPADEYAEIREVALRDLPAALKSFRLLATKVKVNRK